nr:hypothetical protein [Tanacetum cinerariifolium]
MAPLTFADTHNMIAFLTKSDASKGFDQIVDFLNAHTIQYTLIVNPSIYVSCIKQFWASVLVRKTNDVVTLQALIDRKKVVITKDIIRQDIRLDDADGVECLPNEDIFAELARMGYEKPPHNMVRNVDSTSNFLMYTRFLQVMINAQVDDLSSYTTKYTSPALTQNIFANIRRIGKGFSRVETPLFDIMLVQPQADAENDDDDEIYATLTHKVAYLEQDKVAQALEITKHKQRVKKLEKKRRSKHSGLKRLRKMQEKHLDNIKKYQNLKRNPISVAQAKKNMKVYLKNMVGYKIEHFKEEPAKKRGAEETLLQESFKKLRAKVEASGSHTTQEYTPTDDPKEMSEEDVKNIVGGITQAYMIFEGMLKDFDRVDLDALWRLTKEKFSTTMPTEDKEKALFIELKRLYEPNAAKIKRLQAQLRDQKGKSKGTPCVSDTLDPLPQKLENDKVISPRMFWINPFENSMEEKSVPNKSIKASVRTNQITVSQPHVITKKLLILTQIVSLLQE